MADIRVALIRVVLTWAALSNVVLPKVEPTRKELLTMGPGAIREKEIIREKEVRGEHQELSWNGNSERPRRLLHARSKCWIPGRSASFPTLPSPALAQ